MALLKTDTNVTEDRRQRLVKAADERLKRLH